MTSLCTPVLVPSRLSLPQFLSEALEDFPVRRAIRQSPKRQNARRYGECAALTLRKSHWPTSATSLTSHKACQWQQDRMPQFDLRVRMLMTASAAWHAHWRNPRCRMRPLTMRVTTQPSVEMCLTTRINRRQRAHTALSVSMISATFAHSSYILCMHLPLCSRRYPGRPSGPAIGREESRSYTR